MPILIYCTRCDTEKPETDFGINRRRADGRAQYCKACYCKINNAHYRKNREQRQATFATYKQENRDDITQHRRLWRHGLTDEEFAQLQARSSGLCEACKKQPATAIDHDHATGRVRGLLCHWCNWGIGNFKDSPEVLERAAQYLRDTENLQIGSGRPAQKNTKKTRTRRQI